MKTIPTEPSDTRQRSAQGCVYLVGAGPGAPDLLTLRAARLLETADIVFHDALVHPDTLALARRARLVPVGKRAGRVSTDQRFINRHLVEAASQHAVVVRLKGGDPMLFGRAQEEIDALSEAGVPFEVVPGVTAASAASAEVGVSLTRRGLSRSVVYVTPRTGPGEAASDWSRAAGAADTVVLYMAGSDRDRTVDALRSEGWAPSTPVVVVQNASLADARWVPTTLAGLAALTVDEAAGPVLLLVGEVYGELLAANGSTGGVVPERIGRVAAS
ncbi:MAG: uroporphyrinogen-III C-methyltransferase [Betaproteobacteria bacterium]|jgi:uroporphyrin-III C-methyltransferase